MRRGRAGSSRRRATAAPRWDWRWALAGPCPTPEAPWAACCLQVQQASEHLTGGSDWREAPCRHVTCCCLAPGPASRHRQVQTRGRLVVKWAGLCREQDCTCEALVQRAAQAVDVRSWRGRSARQQLWGNVVSVALLPRLHDTVIDQVRPCCAPPQLLDISAAPARRTLAKRVIARPKSPILKFPSSR